MPNAMGNPAAQNQVDAKMADPQGEGDKVAKPSSLVPFVRAARKQTIQTELDKNVALGASSVNVDLLEVPAQGWIRHIDLIIQATGGSGGSAVAAADAPWNVISQIQITDPAGNPIFGPVSGFSLALANIFGGYTFDGDPRLDYSFADVDANGNFTMLLRIPIEASERDGYGALPNSDSSAAYRVTLTQAPSTTVYETPPAGDLPTVRYRAYAEVWSSPTATDLTGAAQAQQPPGAGTTQFWSSEIHSTVAAYNTLRLRRVGNMLRNLIVVFRDADGVRLAEGNMPDPARLQWDSLMLTDEALPLRRKYIQEQYGFNTEQFDGVLVYNFAHDLDGHPGFELRNGLLPTTKATRLEFQGTLGDSGNAEFLINDIQFYEGLK